MGHRGGAPRSNVSQLGAPGSPFWAGDLVTGGFVGPALRMANSWAEETLGGPAVTAKASASRGARGSRNALQKCPDLESGSWTSKRNMMLAASEGAWGRGGQFSSAEPNPGRR